MLETSGEHLNLASLMKQCDALLGDVRVFHKLAVSGGYYEVEVRKMKLNSTILDGQLHLKYVRVGSKDRFGRDIKETPVVVHKERGLLECLGLSALFGNKKIVVVDEADIKANLDDPKDIEQWKVVVPKADILSQALVVLDRESFEKAVWDSLFNTVKTAVMYETGACLSNELLKAILDPLLKCLYEDWNKLLKF